MKTVYSPVADGHAPVMSRDAYYDEFLKFRENIFNNAKRVEREGHYLFSISENLSYNALLDAFPDEFKQRYNCQACRAFFKHYSRLVYIDESNMLQSVMFTGAEKGIFEPFIKNHLQALRKSKHGLEPYLTQALEWGTPTQEDDDHVYNHLWIPANPNHVIASYDSVGAHRSVVKLKIQTAKSLVEKYNAALVEKAIELCESKVVPGKDRYMHDLEWLLEIIKAVNAVPRNLQPNALARLAVKAGISFGHINGSLLGSYLEMLKENKDISIIVNFMNRELATDKHKRPTAPPTDQLVETADEYMTKNNLQLSLERRHAGVHEIPFYWKPADTEDQSKRTGIFANVKTRQDIKAEEDAVVKQSSVMPGVKMSWVVFKRDVLSTLTEMMLDVQYQVYPFMGLTTACHPESTPILVWDKPEERNQLSLYTYNELLPPRLMGLEHGKQSAVVGIAVLPHLMGTTPDEKLNRFGKGDVVIINGCRDARDLVGMGLFPDILRSDLLPFRKVLEAYSNNNFMPEGERNAQGLCITEALTVPITFVTTSKAGVKRRYQIDRFE